MVRKIGLDVHRDFCEVAIVAGGRLRRAGRVATEPAGLTLFAESLGRDDEVVLEATANALAATGLRAKTDKIDAATLAKLLAGGFVPEVWTPDEQTRVRRRLIARRASWSVTERARRTRSTRSCSATWLRAHR
jgi:transposase